MRKKRCYMILLLMLALYLLAGCGKGKGKITDGSEAYAEGGGSGYGKVEEVEILKEVGKIYVVTAIDTERSLLTLQDWESTKIGRAHV